MEEKEGEAQVLLYIHGQVYMYITRTCTHTHPHPHTPCTHLFLGHLSFCLVLFSTTIIPAKLKLSAWRRSRRRRRRKGRAVTLCQVVVHV